MKRSSLSSNSRTMKVDLFNYAEWAVAIFLTVAALDLLFARVRYAGAVERA